MPSAIEILARQLSLGALIEALQLGFGGFELLNHWLQGEFHHDLVFYVEHDSLPAPYLVVSTNCNGGVKEVAAYHERPDRFALWNQRCPENPEFEGHLTSPVELAQTEHYFDPCALLVDDARSELREEYRERQRGGGWVMKDSD